MKQFLLDTFAKGDLESVLENLKTLVKDNKEQKEALLLSVKYKELKEQIRLGTIDSDTAGVGKSKIMVSILELIDAIDEHVQNDQKTSEEPDPISFNITKENGIQVKFKSESLQRLDDIIIPKAITVKELTEALLINYRIKDLVQPKNSFEQIHYDLVVNHVKYSGSENAASCDIPIKDGDLLMIKGKVTWSFIGHTQ